MTVNGWKPLTVITKRSILDFGATLDPPLPLTLLPSLPCLFIPYIFFKYVFKKVCIFETNLSNLRKPRTPQVDPSPRVDWG